MKKKALTKQQCRRMLVTTLGRIERLQDWINWYEPGGELYGEEDEEQQACRVAEMAKLHEDLKYYSQMAREIIAKEASDNRVHRLMDELDIVDKAFDYQWK